MNFESYKGRTIDTAKRLRIYRNLNKPGTVFSIWQSGEVKGYTTNLTLSDCVCVVKEGQRLNVVKNKVRQVHAWIEGAVSTEQFTPAAMISYNPYKFAFFYNVETKAPVDKAQFMQFCTAGVLIK